MCEAMKTKDGNDDHDHHHQQQPTGAGEYIVYLLLRLGLQSSNRVLLLEVRHSETDLAATLREQAYLHISDIFRWYQGFGWK